MDIIKELLERLETSLMASQPNIKYVEMDGIIKELKNKFNELNTPKSPIKDETPIKNEVNTSPAPPSKKAPTSKK
jgi:hypothetical protein